MRILRGALVVGLFLASGPALADECEDTERNPWDTGLSEADCDEDGWTWRDGDCDDFEATVYPGARERCDDYFDNDCDGFFNEKCDDGTKRGSLLGGSSCGTGGPMALVFLPLLALFRRRRDR